MDLFLEEYSFSRLSNVIVLTLIYENHDLTDDNLNESHFPPTFRTPPRPSPGSVNYSDGEDSKYPDEESSSLTEKPSELSSSASDSQVCRVRT